jgi:hypothetical protein
MGKSLENAKGRVASIHRAAEKGNSRKLRHKENRSYYAPALGELTDRFSSGLRILSLARYLEDGNFVLLHVRYPSAGGIRHPTT